MSRYVVAVDGCDDTTYGVVDLTADQAVGVARIAAMTVTRSTSSCHPILRITTYDDAPVYDRERAEEPIDND